MLPAPPSSCAGWWFSQLWRALLGQRPDRYAAWSIHYPEPGELCLRPYGSTAAPVEQIAGSFHEGAERRTIATWDWPGEDGMLHTLRARWQPGEVLVRPLDWARLRQPFPATPAPWPLCVRISAQGWHGQLLERSDLEASDALRRYPIQWEPPIGEPRVPITDLPCSITTLDRRAGNAGAALLLAGLTLPWRIDLDRDAWAIWRRFPATNLLRELGGPAGACPRHGRSCSWPESGRVSHAG